jgi:tetratricopeptide (TPR) repeat protein
MYEVDDNGQIRTGDAERLRQLIHTAIRQGLDEQRNDSPVFEFFPGYSVELSDELRPRESRTRGYSPELKEALARTEATPKRKQTAARAAEEIVKSTSPEDPAAAIEVLKKYRELGAWDDLIRFADELPVSIRDFAQIQQMLALALNRRNRSGDRERALDMMEQLVAKTGGDGETRGILGRIYKDRFGVTGDPADIQKAIEHYRAGFEADPSDYYPGVNLVNLLMVHGGESGRQEVVQVLPRVRASLGARMDPERPEYWELATALELAAIAGDWQEARGIASRITNQAPVRWMVESTTANLKRLEESMSGPAADNLKEIVDMLRRTVESEGRNA